MPLVVTKKALTPAYVDAVVPQAGLRRRNKVAAKREPQFARAWLKIVNGLIDSDTSRDLERAIGKVIAGELTVDEALGVVDWFNPADPFSSKRWELLSESMRRFYSDTIEDAGAGEMKSKGFPLRFTVQKAKESAVRVPVNPWSQVWADTKAARLVAQVSEEQRAMLRQLISERLGQSVRPKEILEEIERIVGLLDREWKAVENRENLLYEKGMEATAIKRATERYAKQLKRKRAKRIARTETIDAYSQGLEDSWQMAKEAGYIEQPLKEWVELTDSPRTCKICRGLAGQRVPVGKPFVSDVIGEVERPPAHPHCRCTMYLVDDEDIAAGPDVNAPIRQADLDAQQARETLAGG